MELKVGNSYANAKFATVEGEFTGDVTGDISGNAGTVTSIGNLTGDVTSTNRSTTISAGAVHHGMLAEDIISGQGALTSGLASTDELMISDDGTIKKMDISVLSGYLNDTSILTNLANVTGDSGNAAIYDNSGTPTLKSGITQAEMRSAIDVDVAGTDNSTNVTLANTNYLSISGQQITGGTVPITSGGTGATSASAAFTALKQAASTTATGVVELATATEAKNGSGAEKVVDASQLGARSVYATIDVSDSSFTSNKYAEITHSLGTEDVFVQLFDSSTKDTVYANVARTDKSNSASTTKIKIEFGRVPANDVEVIITSAAGASAGSVAYA
mgnify:FL=1